MMNKIRVLWLSNVNLLDEKVSHSGTWIYSMFNAICKSAEVEVCANITFTSQKDYYDKYVAGTKHCYVPKRYINNKGLPSNEVVEYIVHIIKDLAPDILHVWGTEYFWGVIAEDRRLVSLKKLLEIQGIKLIWGDKSFFYGGMDRKDLLKTRGVGRWIIPSYRIESLRDRFLEWGEVEKKMFRHFDYINTQSEWVRMVLPYLSTNTNFKKTGIILRESFNKPEPWYKVHERNDDFVIFTTSSPVTWKGFHVTMRAFGLLKQQYPNAKLKVAGISKWNPTFMNRIRGGYGMFLYSLEKELNIEGSVEYLGQLTEEEILANMYSADVFVISSFIESYCLALAEALSIGVPSVSSYTSALTELIKDEETGLLYPLGDYYVCASKISRILEDKELAERLSINSSKTYREKNDIKAIVRQQIETYKDMV